MFDVLITSQLTCRSESSNCSLVVSTRSKETSSGTVNDVSLTALVVKRQFRQRQQHGDCSVLVVVAVEPPAVGLGVVVVGGRGVAQPPGAGPARWLHQPPVARAEVHQLNTEEYWM